MLSLIQHPSGRPADTRRAGFTLVEILCAVVLLSIGLLAVMTATQSSRQTQQRAQYLSIGRNVAQSKMEALRTISFDSLAAQAATTSDSSLPAGNQVVVAVDPYPDSSEANLKRATVTVTWPEGNGTRRIRYDTLITRK